MKVANKGEVHTIYLIKEYAKIIHSLKHGLLSFM